MPRPTAEKKLRGALAFSLVVIPGVAAWALWVAPPPEDEGAVFMAASTMVFFSLAGIFAVWALLSALLSVRPALSHPMGRWVWLWTLVCCGAFATIGFAHSAEQTLGSTLLYACGTLALISGAIGLPVSAMPLRRNPNDPPA